MEPLEVRGAAGPYAPAPGDTAQRCHQQEAQDVPPGYKRTEVGVIPEDWDVCEISALTSEVGDGIHSTPIYSTQVSEFKYSKQSHITC
jgi:hypothetical protein